MGSQIERNIKCDGQLDSDNFELLLKGDSSKFYLNCRTNYVLNLWKYNQYKIAIKADEKFTDLFRQSKATNAKKAN